MNEQIIKRLQDTMKLFSVVLEQLEQLQWLVKDIIEDLEVDLNSDSFIGEKKEGDGKPTTQHESAVGCPSNVKEGCPS